MSSKRTPWSGSRHRPGVSADRFGSLDPGVIRAATSRGRAEHPAPSARPESASAESDAESEDEDPPPSGPAAPAPAADRFPRPAAEKGSAHTAGPPAPWPAESADLYEYLPHADTAGALPIGGQALIGLCLGLAVLLAVSCFYLNPTADEPAASPATLATAVSTRTATEEVPPEESSPDIGVGFVFGKVKTNDGSTLHVSSELTKSEIVVHTDAETRVYVLIATEVAAIAVGAPVLVYGRKHADGTISADTITGVSLRAIGSS